MEGHILLKKLTEKSVIQAGKNKGLTVGDLLQIKKIDLIYSYFNYGALTFTDEILDKLTIYPEDRIEKPGKNPEKFKKYADRNMYIASKIIASKIVNENTAVKDPKAIAKIIRKNKQKAEFKAKYKRLIKKEKISFSKEALMRKNHGH
jgi:hypothetical protein